MTPATLDFRNVNALWASVIAETLVRAGVGHVVVSPGSRSTPLAFAFAANAGLEAIPMLDERSASFFALGLAKREGRPVALLCTSGTAGANYFPAVIEAHEAGVPLVVFTADRPPEMRGCASGQTIDQQGLFGGYAGFFHELATPEATEPLLRYLRQSVAHAVDRARGPLAGPVHLNVPFRDPLVPSDDSGRTLSAASRIDWDLFFEQVQPAGFAAVLSSPPLLSASVHGVVVAGPLGVADGEAHAAAVGEISRRLGWPVLADGLSALRNHASKVPHLVTRYDAILRDANAAESLKPEVVLVIGEWPTSKILRSVVESARPVVYLLTQRPDNRDALHGSTRRVLLTADALAQSLPLTESINGYQRMWASYERRASEELSRRLAAAQEMIEPKAAWLLGKHLPAHTTVSVANSMPIRDMEFVWPENDRGLRVFFNRGANGIDGTLSTAMGVAHGSAPSVLLTGDLAFLHDSNGLLACPRLKGSLTVVLINNNGGGIFEHLAVAQYPQVFEEFFATPQQVDVSKLCAAHGVEHVKVSDWAQFESLVVALPEKGVRVLELTTDRKRDAQWRRENFGTLLRAP